MIVHLYRKYIPARIRKIIYIHFLRDLLSLKRDFKLTVKCKLRYFFPCFFSKTEEFELYRFMGHYGIMQTPYPSSLKYRGFKTKVEINPMNGLPFVIHEDKKLYFPKDYTFVQINYAYKNLLMEQEEDSAHRYVANIQQLTGATLLDIGAAEGIFALSAIDVVKQVYLFECEDQWIPVLEATFAPWSEKVQIVKSMVSDKTSEKTISIDDFMIDKDKTNLFLKMDIEGAETDALIGAIQTIKESQGLQASICTYHLPDDANRIATFFQNLHFPIQFTDGFFCIKDKLRKGVLRVGQTTDAQISPSNSNYLSE